MHLKINSVISAILQKSTSCGSLTCFLKSYHCLSSDLKTTQISIFIFKQDRSKVVQTEILSMFKSEAHVTRENKVRRKGKTVKKENRKSSFLNETN